jgi:hypothetical protein
MLLHGAWEVDRTLAFSLAHRNRRLERARADEQLVAHHHAQIGLRSVLLRLTVQCVLPSMHICALCPATQGLQ